MLRRRLLSVSLAAAALAGCDQPGKQEAAHKQVQGLPLLIAPEDLHTLRAGERHPGPVVTGSIQPERRADLRAEVSAVVLQVLKENGEAVRQGDLLMRLDDTSIRDSLASAEESAHASTQAFEQAERQVLRLKTLQSQGMSSIQALEDAQVRWNNAKSELVSAKAKVVAARQQLRRTEVRAPFDGVVSERKASVGDTVQVGKELVKVIDPGSMRFEGLVSADRMLELGVGQPVSFRVSGFPKVDFDGKVTRVDATANATTRQIEVLVAFADSRSAPRTAGLYAEGRIEGAGAELAMLTLPESSIVRSGNTAYVWRVKDRTLTKVPVQLGERDVRRGDYPLQSGLADGDQILCKPGSTLVDGQKIEFVSAGSGAASGS